MDARIAVLGAVAEAILPPLEVQAAEVEAADPAAATFLRHSGASSEVLFKVVETVETRLPAEARGELYLLLRLLHSRLGSLLLLGRAAFSNSWLPCSFTALPRARREAVLLGWSASPDARMRKAFKALKSLLMSVQFSHLAPDGSSAILAALRYPIADPERPLAPAPAAVAAEPAVAAALVDLSQSDSSPGSAASAGAALAAKGMRVVWPGDAGAALALARERPQLTVQCDVVVVGSGAGGGVAAANLARAGLRVVVLEKAGFVPARDMTLQEGEAFGCMYEQGGILSSEDGTMSVLAGATLGGGTRINWCASFQTPPHVRREWVERYGLPAFGSQQYDEALEAVCSRLGVHTGFKHSAMCSTLRSGLEGVGIHCGEVPRNCASADCGGHCCFGCARGHKQDTVNTWLADACQAGAHIITGVWAERVILEPNPESSRGSSGQSSSRPADATEAEGGAHAPRHKRAAGVLALAGSGPSQLKLAVQAPVVISAAGSLHSPALLQRSCITCGGQVGANLRLHPCTCVVGLFPPERSSSNSSSGSGGGGGTCSAEQGAAAGAGAPAGPAAGPAGAHQGLPDLEDLAGSAAAAKDKAAQGSAAAAATQQQQQQEQHQERRLHMLPPSAGEGPGSVRPWEGTLMSIFSTQAGDWEGSGYGCLLYTPAVHPALFAATGPWLGGEDYKRLMLHYPHSCVVLVLVRDSGSGRVVADRSGRPRIHYTLSKADEASMMKGVELGLRSMAAAGASDITTVTNSPAGRFSFREAAPLPSSSNSGGVTEGGADAAAPAAPAPAPAAAAAGVSPAAGRANEAFEAYLARVAQAGVVPLQMAQFSAHQMGTCRLGPDPAASVLDPSGECWEVAGLYCMDGSTFPSPTGVNPMISIEAISYMLSKQLAGRLSSGIGRSNQGDQASAGSKL